MLSIIVAIGKNYEIGQNNSLLCHLSDDLKRFKQITSGHTVLMGKNTYLSLPVKPLPKRTNIVLTRDLSISFSGCKMAHSIEEAMQIIDKNEETFIMGGADIYKQFFPLCNKLYVTRIDAEFPNADTFFPKIEEKEWKIIENTQHPADENHIYNFTYQTYVKKENHT
ncbi:MAG: dihydrofolate reductase [Bacteroidales bacterium]|nr:dihydrofolate reductase [Bacteroidales bacterium]